MLASLRRAAVRTDVHRRVLAARTPMRGALVPRRSLRGLIALFLVPPFRRRRTPRMNSAQTIARQLEAEIGGRTTEPVPA